MHIPDGFLSVLVSIAFWVISVVVITIALRKTAHILNERQVSLMGVMAAAIFAGQMVNFSVTGGTSGHLLGAALAAILLGPWPAVLVMTSVVSVQALIFQDGGLLALGANIFNMAIIGSFVSFAFYSILNKIFTKFKSRIPIAGFGAAWASIFIASLACALQLALSGTSPANIVVPAMAAIHALIGIGEGLITTSALLFLQSARKDLILPNQKGSTNSKSILWGGGLISLVLVILSPLASVHPDGLEWVAQQNGFLETAQSAVYKLIPDYSLPGISNTSLATKAAGILGILIVFSVAIGIARAEKQVNVNEVGDQ
jgi:cobalt/nickel transport system permease protein